MSGDLLELLFVAAFILFGLLGGRRKKRPATPAQRPRQRPAPRAGADRPPVRSPAARAPAPTARGGTEQDRLLRELEGLLTGRPVPPVPEPAQTPGPMGELPDPDEARSLESLEVESRSTWDEAIERPAEVMDVWRAGRARAAETLETLEEAGEASHRRFHTLYDRQPEIVQPRRTEPAFRTADIRRAIIWSEILGPPVSER